MPTQEEKDQILALGKIDIKAHAALAEKNGWEGKAKSLLELAKAVNKLVNDEEKDRSDYLVPKTDFLKEKGRGKNQGL